MVPLPRWQGARLFCSTRQGGVSGSPYDTLNLGDHVGDDPRDVQTNRHRLLTAWGVTPVFLNQVHGTDVCLLSATDMPHPLQADASFTRVKRLACTVLVADCLPVLFYLPQARVVAAAHAGWRGLSAGVLKATWKALSAYGDVKHCKVWLGPCIGPQAFEVGADVWQAFCGKDPEAQAGFVASPKDHKFLANLAWLARRELSLLGLGTIEGNDGSPSWCTYSQPELYYSHRRDGVSGRFAVGIALD